MTTEKVIIKPEVKTSAKKMQVDALGLLLELLSKLRTIDNPEIQKLFEDFKTKMKGIW